MIVLLVIIYVTFVSLGLPDALLGSGWPTMYQGLGVPMASAGIISMIIFGGTILSSFASGRVVRRLGFGLTVAISVTMTATALVGISLSGNFIMICLWAIPLGLGAGSIDSSLNNFVALYYNAKYMNWLHCFWGVGASISPIIMSFALDEWNSWNLGYRIVGIFQICLAVFLFATLPLWKRANKIETDEVDTKKADISFKKLFSLPAAKETLVAFFCYCSVEVTVALWGSSYLVTARNVPASTAASWIALYYGGITVGRFLSGILAIKFDTKQMVRIGVTSVAIGIAILFTPLPSIMMLVALFFIGLGCAPIFPSLLHETPTNFGSENSQTMIGVQMGCAYMGSTLMPPLFGLIATKISYHALPFFLGIFLTLMIVLLKISNKKLKSLS